jgi:DNA-binding NtrC family response regulator
VVLFFPMGVRAEYEAWRKAELAKVRPFSEFTRAAQVAEINRVLELCHGDRSEAAAYLGIGRTTLYRFLQQPAPPQPKPSSQADSKEQP